MERADPRTAPPPARIFVVDDHPIVREGLAAQIANHPDLSLCGDAEDLAGALELIVAARPDVAVIDISLKTGNGIDLIKRLKERMASVGVLVWSMYPERLYAERALRAGALGYVHKGSASRQIIEAIRSVLAGKIYVSRELSEKLVTRLVGGGPGRADRPPVETLSDRELEAFQLVGEGLNTREIARRMHVSPKTVETYRARIKVKLGLATATELIQHAVQWLASQR